MRHAVSFALSLFAAAACGAPHETKAPTATMTAPGNPEGELERFFPLQEGTVYSYDTISEPGGGKGLLIVQVSRPRPGRADLRMGSHTERLELESGAIASVAGGYVLKAPLTVGSRWRGRSGDVHVASIDESVDVPAGHFEGCVRTVEVAGATGTAGTVTSLYCPHVGLTTLDAEGDRSRETARLRSFGPRVDVGGDGVTTTVDSDAGPAAKAR